jgi:hypothetical protein
MHLAVLTPAQASSATLLLGAPTNSYQSPGATFSKLFATYPSFTMTGLAIEITDYNHRELVQLEHTLLQAIQDPHRMTKTPITGIEGHIASRTRGAHSWSAPEHCALSSALIRIVGVWDTDTEFGLVYKLTPAKDTAMLIRSPPATGTRDVVYPCKGQPDPQPEEQQPQQHKEDAADLLRQHLQERLDAGQMPGQGRPNLGEP